MKKNKVTDKKKKAYVKRGGKGCPACGPGVWDVEGSSVSIEGSRASQEVTCNKCGLVWYDLYSLDEVVIVY